ncbi:hypothetical protein B0J13DRAFT_660202 [Dactylonectria estremocensis]|uniref:Steroid 5-alpha reductase C-terminal domain-containing protein n=1 Tax=Dactylonectria estremocensis TaxID=1079267 RepID=A0A9P9D1W9_9HYPO|nr:hypothetical protein B0J13DRAFT_660202 [Dactylonectria estremocensis]
MAKQLQDNLSRVKHFNLLGTSIFVGLRAADAFLQYGLLQRGWAPRFIELLGGHVVDRGMIANAATTQLQPYFGAISLMACGSSLKQILALLIVSEQDMPPSSAFVIALFNTVFNSLNAVFSVWAATSQRPTSETLAGVAQSPLVLFGVGFYTIGILTEMISELQRTYFKRNPTNKGKPYANGLFSLARHINYGGYTIWRAAYAVSSGGWPWGLTVFSFFFYDFVSRGVPVLDTYLSERYGEEWKLIKKRVPYSLIPGIY